MIQTKLIREKTIAFSCRHNAGHLAPSLSSVEILSVLFREFLHFNAHNATDSARDRLIFSKGHGCYAYYVILNELGFIPDSEMEHFGSVDSKLKGCVSYTPTFMLEASTGSLGHGLPLAVGIAQSFKMQGKKQKVICIIGDGEMQEGSNFEALALAYRFKLDNLLVIIDANGLCAMDYMQHVGLDTDRLARVLSAYVDSGFYDVDGHNENELRAAYSAFFNHTQSNMSIILARTIKGKGLAMIENKAMYHYRCPTQDGYKMPDSIADSINVRSGNA
ncbi:1-deoxy-D-xylulose-5-phosphate synthase N-terminal domain-containing protein [Helicobacter jaachi]|uniref:1-deoxy-D-xylulose-5-phosphate synthase N-terminal domain-containing protein n=1 Tax=Helicobacter jaachi TaxID=1677920 RepID=UPI00068DEC08|nr:1-deoxy-D-xylulose-5-phosphate synthase N-terminal domain-containing protein [Helicobacter jaachi]